MGARSRYGDRFEVERPLARGGMGEVFVARDRVTDRLVALKLMRLEGATHEARFRREASVLERLHHPAIVRHVASGTEADGVAWLAMEWIEGEDLRARQRRAPLTLDQAVVVAARIADALSAAHGVGVIHRDLKPSNVMLGGNDAGAACLLDFGVAHVDAQDETVITHTGIIGTPGYMAPEQARGATIDARADLFSLGCMLYTLVVGTPPFEGADSLSVLARLLFEPSPRIHTHRPDAPHALDELVASLMQKDREKRPSSAAAVAASLRELGTLIGGPPPPRSMRASEVQSSVPRLLCLVLGISGDASATDLDASTLAEKDARGFTQIAEVHDARMLPLGGGSVLFTLSGAAAATDLAEKGVRCARALRAARPDLAIAVGTGVGETTSVGALGNLLVRIRALAERGRGRILIDGPTARLVGDRWDTAEHDGDHQLLGRASARGPARLLLGRETPLVGRDGELALLRAIVSESADEPAPRVALIFGEAGSGKSRLRQAIARGASERATVWMARGDLLAKRSPLSLARQLLRAGLDLPEGTAPPAVHARLAEAARGAEPAERDLTAALLAELLGAPWTHDEPPALRAARDDVRLLAEQTRLAFARIVVSQAREGPLLLTIDDLQWGDYSSLQYLDAALAAADGLPVMALLLGRPEARTAFSGVFSARHLTALDLPPLSRSAVRTLSRAMLQNVAPAVVDRLFALSGGNAFYLEELIRQAAQGGDLTRAEGLVPVIQARIDALSPAAHEVLRAACVFGHVFWARGVEAIVGDRDRVAAGLAELQSRELVARRTTRRFVDEDEWIVRNELVHDVAYALLREDDRAKAHRHAGHWLTAVGEQDALVLAEHFARGGVPGAESRWLARAAESALEANALEDAVTHARRALGSAETDEARCALWLLLAEVHRLRGDFVAVTEACLAAEAIAAAGSASAVRARAERVAALVRLGRASDAIETALGLGSTEPLAVDAVSGLALARAAMALAMAGDAPSARALIDRIAREQGPLLQPSRAAACALLALSEAGDLVEYVGWTEQALAGFEAAGDPRSACAQRINLGYGSLRLGATEEATAHLAAAVETAKRLGLPHLRAAALHNLGLAFAMRDEHDRAAALQREALAAFVSQGDVRLAGGARCYLALSLVALDRAADARREAELATEALAEVPPMLAHAVIALARAARATDELALAVASGKRAVAIVDREPGARDARILAHLELADALDAVGDAAGAARALTEAERALAEIAARIGDPTRRAQFLTGVPEHRRLQALLVLRRPRLC